MVPLFMSSLEVAIFLVVRSGYACCLMVIVLLMLVVMERDCLFLMKSPVFRIV